MADEQTAELRMEPGALYREDTFTDRRVGVIRVLTPVTDDGSIDLGRKILYVGEAQLLSPVGALPICSVAGRPSKVSVKTESLPGPEASAMR